LANNHRNLLSNKDLRKQHLLQPPKKQTQSKPISCPAAIQKGNLAQKESRSTPSGRRENENAEVLAQGNIAGNRQK
jgi:hypothetical protein